MKVFAIDPGNEQSAYVIWDSVKGDLVDCAKIGNQEMLDLITRLYSPANYHDYDIVIEMIASYGMAVGKTVFETVFWIGRFYERALEEIDNVSRLYRKDVKINLCNSMRAKDSNIRAAIIDRVGNIGTKGDPGPLYKVRGSGGKDIWAALGVALTYCDLNKGE